MINLIMRLMQYNHNQEKSKVSDLVYVEVYDTKKNVLKKRSLLRDLVLTKMKRALKDRDPVALVPLLRVEDSEEGKVILTELSGRETFTSFTMAIPDERLAQLIAQALKMLGHEVKETKLVPRCEKRGRRFVIGRLKDGVLELYYCQPRYH